MNYEVNWEIHKMTLTKMQYEIKAKNNKVLPRFELGSLDSESKVLTITP